MTKIDRVFQELQDGPGTSFEIASELGFYVGEVSAMLNVLRHQRKVQRSDERIPAAGNKGRRYFIWSVA